MPRYVVLLRGVNLAGRNKVAMADLRKWLQGEGFTDVVTKGASGNVVLSSTLRASESVRKKVAALLLARMKKEIGVTVRTPADMKAVVARAPFKGEAADGELFVVTFVPGGETFAVVRIVDGRPEGYGKVDKALQTQATTRSWDVVKALADAA